MDLYRVATPTELGRTAADLAAEAICAAIDADGEATIIVATGASQFATLAHLVAAPDIDWSRVTGFHLDEYLGLADSHPASFRRYLRERFVERVPALAAFHYVDGSAADPAAECARLGALIAEVEVAVACIGIGENGHLAFNDPPADVETEVPYLVVELDEACRRQQLGEGWFESMAAVPQRAITMSIRQILKARQLVVSVPDERKAAAVAGAVAGPLEPSNPAAYLRDHPNCQLVIDEAAASQLPQGAGA